MLDGFICQQSCVSSWKIQLESENLTFGSLLGWENPNEYNLSSY